jgi:catechol 2,3-dioxygenase-like lactoylglutathione lyase family enzyme
MHVKGIGWLGTRTDNFAAMVEFATDVLGLTPSLNSPDLAIFHLPDGDEFEVFAAGNDDLPFPNVPVAAFLVADVDHARAEMEAKGVDFLGPTQHHGAFAWAYFRAPDGHVYEITHRPDKPEILL